MGILLHIGVPKTGTTAVQAALTELLARPGDPAPGVTMPGTPAEQARAALSVLGQGQGWRRGEALPSAGHWPRLVAQARAATGTVVVSSEFLCEADPATIARIAADLSPGPGEEPGGDGLRVVITLRPLARILPSAWQQYLKSGHQLPYEKWLLAVLSDPPKASVTPSFWRRHDHGAVVRRWAERVGAGRVSVVVLDEHDRGLLMRSFDAFLGLPAGTLTDPSADPSNRSMTAAEAELFRRVNAVLRGTDMTWSEYAHLVRYGAVLRTVSGHTPPPDAPRPATPAWARDRAIELAAGYVAAIEGLRPAGLQVVGDLAGLARPVPAPAGEQPGTPDTVPVDAAVEALLGVLARATEGPPYFPAEGRAVPGGRPGSEPVNPLRLTVDRLTTRQLVQVLGRRVTKRARRALDELPGRGPARPGPGE